MAYTRINIGSLDNIASIVWRVVSASLVGVVAVSGCAHGDTLDQSVVMLYPTTTPDAGMAGGGGGMGTGGGDVGNGGASAGAPGNGGMPMGNAGAGEAPSSGGTKGSGGAPSSGGAPMGGTGSGGKTGAGGMATGGTRPSTGGSASGGAQGNGGASTGGARGNGGAATGGGGASSGGSAGSGGSTSACKNYTTNDACSTCICSKCATQVAACFDSGDTTANSDCAQIQNCAQQNHCASTWCYCQSGSSAACLPPGGKCQSVIEMVDGTTNPIQVGTDGADKTKPLGRANDIGMCTESNCKTECGVQ